MRKKIIIVFRLFSCRADSITAELCQTRFVVRLENALPSAVHRNNCFPGALQFWHFTSNGQRDRLPCRRTKNLIITGSYKWLVITPAHPPHYHFSKTMYFISRLFSVHPNWNGRHKYFRESTRPKEKVEKSTRRMNYAQFTVRSCS